MAWIPIAAPAPGLFSTTTGCPVSLDNCCPTTRATMSMVPPAGAATTSLMGFSGHAQAAQARVIPSAAAAARTCSCIAVSPLWLTASLRLQALPRLANLGHSLGKLGHRWHGKHVLRNDANALFGRAALVPRLGVETLSLAMLTRHRKEKILRKAG